MFRNWSSHRWWIVGFALAVFLTLLVLDQFVFPLPKHNLFKPTSTFVYSRDGQLLSAFTSSDRFWRRPVTLAEISPRLIESVIAVEDQWFYYHPGLNPFSLVSAAAANISAGKIKRGGSTITMQIARMMEPKARTFLSKAIEILRAFQLEVHYSKDELLEIYFGLVPYGGNIEGVGAAAYFYFDKLPSQLSWSEAAVLTAIPVSPTRLRPDHDVDLCRSRRDRVLNTLVNRSVISQSEKNDAAEERIPTTRQVPPQIAPHFAKMVDLKYAEQATIHSTLDWDIQTTCERLSKLHHTRLRPMDINNLAVVVLDNHTGQMLAMIGSPDFSDSKNEGQVNGVLAARSPGSTLKPFVYTLAFQEGLASPLTHLDDIPVNYSGYQPDNYDETFHGYVSLREALVHSYNVPAVNLTSTMGLSKVYNVLRSGGLSTLTKKPIEYGLPLVLGGCEVRLLDLANLYSTIARGGLRRTVEDTIGAAMFDTLRIFDPGPCFMITQILADLKRPDLPDFWEATTDMPRVAWKTGTSYGRRDAWSIGFNPDYTVGVWAGNFSGRSSVNIVGALIATPIMMDIFQEIIDPQKKIWFSQPAKVRERHVCAISGQLPGEYCQTTLEELFIPGLSPSSRCEIHKQIQVDRLTGYRLCRRCADSCQPFDTVVTIYPARVAGWLNRSGIATALPPHNPNCPVVLAGDLPVITSPEKNARYHLIKDIPLAYQKILLQASVYDGEGRIHWFLNGELLASANSGDRLFHLPEYGNHTLTCVDDNGRASSIQFRVE